MPVTPSEAVRLWRAFANNTTVSWKTKRYPWATHISGGGSVDEEKLIQSTVFPVFAQQLLDFTVGLNLAPEESGDEGKPDFTPADQVTHPFVFETKSTVEGPELEGHDSQIRRYLVDGGPRIRKVVLTNLWGVRILELDERNAVITRYSINLRALLLGAEDTAASAGDARRLADFLEEFTRRELSSEQKLQRVREAPDWNPVVESTSVSWLLTRLDTVVRILTRDVQNRVQQGALTDPTLVGDTQKQAILSELRWLANRLGMSSPDSRDISGFVSATDQTPAGKALAQYCGHVAYYAATRLMLVRVWEDLGLLEPMLYDGGFNSQMTRFDDAISDVIDHSFSRARRRYRHLFDQQNNYTWYTPDHDTYADVIYELANTYLGTIQSDILGQVYENLLERVDRKLLGQYYTPRDIIRFIWKLVDVSPLVDRADNEGRELRTLDIATGSGGFLVDLASYLRHRFLAQQSLGASIGAQDWVNRIARGLNGVEVQRFSAYLAELNLLVQLGQTIAADKDLRLAPLGIIPADSLSLHDPDVLMGDSVSMDDQLLVDDPERRTRAERLKDPYSQGAFMDVVCGNPPYIGEKTGSAIMQRTRRDHPYWERFVGQHMDYLYWFLILGVSKLRQGGRFGFITTEYWLRSVGARELRRYLARRCRIERIILFRQMRLFPDAPGQHSMVIIGERTSEPDGYMTGSEDAPPVHRPLVTIYEGPSIKGVDRATVLELMLSDRPGLRGNVRTFRAPVSPNEKRGDSWGEVTLTSNQYQRRQQLRANSQELSIDTEEGVLSSADKMRKGYDEDLSEATLLSIGWPHRKSGIFTLSPEEAQNLGQLTGEEKEVLRPVLNTKDILPYVGVLPEQPARLIYLAAPQTGSTVGNEREAASFPKGLPNIERHLRRFKPLLERKVEDYGERRPWWSLHRARPGILAQGSDGQWGDYCLTTRWGGGQRLVVGLPPAGSVPASGLHALIPPKGIPASYLCGLLNSRVVQDLAETLPPGKLTAGDIRELGLPLLTEEVDAVSDTTRRIADLLTGLATTHAPRFPELLDTLLEDIELEEVPYSTWVPDPGPPTTWGALREVTWIAETEVRGALRATFRSTEVTEDLYGMNVVAWNQRGSVTIRLRDNDPVAASVLETYVRGAAVSGTVLASVVNLPTATDPRELIAARREDEESLRLSVSRYRSLRQDIEDRVAAAL